MSPETVAYLRDWVIIVWGVIATIAALGFLIVALLLYRKLSAILNSIQAAARGVRDFSHKAMEQVSALSPFLHFFSRKKRDRDEEEESEDGHHETARDRKATRD